MLKTKTQPKKTATKKPAIRKSLKKSAPKVLRAPKTVTKVKAKKPVKINALKLVKKSVPNSKIIIKKFRAKKERVKINVIPASSIFSFLIRPFIKITSLFLLVAINWYSISAIGSTLAYFNDTEISRENIFTATDLDFSLNFLRSDGFRTQTQGGWGAKAHGGNSAVYRDANFDGAFPNGLTVGEIPKDSGNPEFSAHFMSSQAIENFLPGGGTAAAFTEDYENPTDTSAGVLAGQAVALTLSLGFDEFDHDFSLNESYLKNFKANEEANLCKDMTAGEVLTEANKILSGVASDFSPSAINECVTEINEKFDNGIIKKVTPEISVWRQIDIIKDGKLNFRHNIKIEQASGDTDLCETLILDASFNGASVYSGNLLNFTYGPEIFSDPTAWKLVIGLPAGAPLELRNKICGLKYIIDGWQENLSLPGEGFSDTEEILDSISSGDWQLGVVMNEFLSNPEGEEYGFDFGADEDMMPKGEWIELYNNSNSPRNLNGWYFNDLEENRINITGTNSSSGSALIQPHDWLVIYMNGAILNNTGDETIKLYDNNDNLIDFYSYSDVVPGNKSYARIPDGTGAWADPIPTPGRQNILEIFPEKVITPVEPLIEAAETLTPEPIITEPEASCTESLIISDSEDIIATISEETIISSDIIPSEPATEPAISPELVIEAPPAPEPTPEPALVPEPAPEAAPMPETPPTGE